MKLHAQAALLPGKSPRYPLDRMLGGPQSRSGRRGEEKILNPTRTRTPTPRSSSPVASRCTDCATPAPVDTHCDKINKYLAFMM
jgi:hypothetical protein